MGSIAVPVPEAPAFIAENLLIKDDDLPGTEHSFRAFRSVPLMFVILGFGFQKPS